LRSELSKGFGVLELGAYRQADQPLKQLPDEQWLDPSCFMATGKTKQSLAQEFERLVQGGVP
jgi:hypothetical protein